VIGYLLPAGCFSEILPVLSNVFLGLPTPLTTLAMLVICLMTDILGSVGMIYEYPESDIMKRKPRDASVDRLVSFKGILKIYIQIGVIQSIIAFFMYFYTMKEYGIDGTQLVGAFEKWSNNGTFAGADLDTRNNALKAASTAFFVSLVMTQLINILTVRTTYQSIFKQRFRPALLLFMLGEVVVVVLFCYIPTFQPYFQTVNMNWYNFVFPIGLGLSIIIVDEIKKLLFRKYPNSFLRHLIF
jgi:sodium/potassium-transporting ATPase subunit alpha